MKNGDENPTRPFGVLRRFVEVDDPRVQRIARIDLDVDRAVEAFIRTDVAEALAIGDRPRLLDDEPDDVCFARRRPAGEHH